MSKQCKVQLDHVKAMQGSTQSYQSKAKFNLYMLAKNKLPSFQPHATKPTGNEKFSRKYNSYDDEYIKITQTTKKPRKMIYWTEGFYKHKLRDWSER